MQYNKALGLNSGKTVEISAMTICIIHYYNTNYCKAILYNNYKQEENLKGRDKNA